MNKSDIDLEMRPGGMLVQMRENGEEDDVVNSSLGSMIKIKVSQGSTLHEVFAPAQSTFGIPLLNFKLYYPLFPFRF